MIVQQFSRPNAGGEASERQITVLVTGFGPFQDKYPVNPSFEIARSLPHLLPRSGSKSRSIRIITYGSPIRVCYREARALVPSLLEGYQGTIDMVLHIGMASGRKYYTAERYAHRDNYDQHKDLDGEVPSLEEALEQFPDCPVMMESSLDYETMLRFWQSTVSSAPEGSPAHGADCRSSEDAGHYLCDYTYFNSLTWYGRRHQRVEDGKASDRPVMFLHVPAESDDETLETGREVAVALIRSMVDVFCASP